MEAAKRAVAVRLQSAEFTALLAAIDAEKGEGVTPGPTHVYRGRCSAPGEFGFPIAEVVGRISHYAEEENQVKAAVHEIAVIWTQTGDDGEAISTHLERLLRATRDLLWNALLEEIASTPVIVVSEEYSDLLPSSQQPFVQFSETLLRVPTIAI